LLVTAKIPSSLTPFPLMLEAILSSETSVQIRAARRQILEKVILHFHRRESFKLTI
jgi:hypothetical protein